jgi:hypothetical protein
MKYNVGIGRGALENILHSRIIRELVSVSAKEGAPGLTLCDEFRRAHVALLEVYMTVLDSERADVAVAVERDLSFGKDGWECVVWLDAVEDSMNLAGD